jgi:hypothetical protein
MTKAFTIVTALCALCIWRVLRMVGLTIPTANRQSILAKLTVEIGRLGYPPPTSHKNELTFYSAVKKSAVVVTISDSSIDIVGPPAVRKGLTTVFPEAVEKPIGRIRARGLTFVLSGWAVIMVILFFVAEGGLTLSRKGRFSPNI